MTPTARGVLPAALTRALGTALERQVPGVPGGVGVFTDAEIEVEQIARWGDR